MSWPNKSEREGYEIKGFIETYQMLPHGRKLQIKAKREQPDYLLEDLETGDYFGVELTSVYLSDRSVPDTHIRKNNGVKSIPHNLHNIQKYKQRLLKAIIEKTHKAKKGYDKTYPLILAVYVNEYDSIHMDTEDWEDLVLDNEYIFDEAVPFSEIVFWNLKDKGVFSIVPQPNNKQLNA